MLFGPQLPESQKPHQQFPRVANGVYPKRTKQIFSICYFHNEMTLSVSLSHEIPGTFKHITLACAFVLFLFFCFFFWVNFHWDSKFGKYCWWGLLEAFLLLKSFGFYRVKHSIVIVHTMPAINTAGEPIYSSSGSQIHPGGAMCA